MKIPIDFLTIKYNPKQIPVDHLHHSIFEKGANCQLFAYELLRDCGKKIPPLRSSNLWEDTENTLVVDDSNFECLDLMLYHSEDNAWGAHVGVYIGKGLVLHLSQENGIPEVRRHESFSEIERYQYFIGAKRVLDDTMSIVNGINLKPKSD